MKKIKEIVMMVVVIIAAAGIIYFIACKTMNKQDVKIQAYVLHPDGTTTGVGSDSDDYRNNQLQKLHQQK